MKNKNNLIKKYVINPGVLTLWIIACVFVFDTLFLKLGLKAGWPAYFACLFFFEMGMDPKKLKNVFGGGAVGLLIAMVMPPMLSFFTPIFGHLFAILTMLLILVFIIMSLESAFPVLFNNVTFTYLVFSFMFIDSVPEYTFIWMAEFLLGAGMLNLGLVFIAKLLKLGQEDKKVEEVNE